MYFYAILSGHYDRNGDGKTPNDYNDLGFGCPNQSPEYFPVILSVTPQSGEENRGCQVVLNEYALEDIYPAGSLLKALLQTRDNDFSGNQIGHNQHGGRCRI
jgi:hypothetical protein